MRFAICEPIGFSDVSELGCVRHMLGQDGVAVYMLQVEVLDAGVRGVVWDGHTWAVFSDVGELRDFASFHGYAGGLVRRGVIHRDFGIIVLRAAASLPLFEQRFDDLPSDGADTYFDAEWLYRHVIALRERGRPDHHLCLSFACAFMSRIASRYDYSSWDLYSDCTRTCSDYDWLAALSLHIFFHGDGAIYTYFGQSVSCERVTSLVRAGYAVMLPMDVGTDFLLPTGEIFVLDAPHVVVLANVDDGDIVMIDQMGLRRCDASQLSHICDILEKSNYWAFLVGVKPMRESLSEIKSIVLDRLVSGETGVVIDSHDGTVRGASEVRLENVSESRRMRVNIADSRLAARVSAFFDANSDLFSSDFVHAGILIDGVPGSDIRDLDIVDIGREPLKEVDFERFLKPQPSRFNYEV
jgi:hypothetical protein